MSGVLWLVTVSTRSLVAYLFGPLLLRHGIGSGKLTVEAAWGNGQFAGTQRREEFESNMEADVVQHFHRQCIYRGSDVRLSTGVLMRPNAWPRQSFPTGRWKWKTILSFGQKGAHINVLELRAALATLRWRLRKADNVRTRVLHLMDSQVCISVTVKGRSSSQQLMTVLRRLNALVLAGGLVTAYGFVRSEDNPADRPSRWPPKSKC